MFTSSLKAIIFIAVLLVIVVSGGIWYIYNSQTTVSNSLQNKLTPDTTNKPNVVVLVKGTNTVVIRWSDLPPETTSLSIFRVRNGELTWSFWTSVSINKSQLPSGEIEVQVPDGDGSAYSYHYYIEANATNTDEPTWVSDVTDPEPYVPLGEEVPQNDESEPPNNPPSSPTETIPPPTSSDDNAPPQNDEILPPLPPPQSQSIPTYYSPNGQVSYAGDITPTGSFWVRHINNYIEVGWQNIPTTTNAVKVYRSVNQNGPWTLLMQQNNPDAVGPAYIRLIDLTISESYYYQLTAFDDTTLLATYGPEHLESL